MEIYGRYGIARVFTDKIEPDAVEQIRRLMDQEFVSGSKVRIMPDVHAGAGCTIGTTMTVSDKAVPNLVGVDIGCGMYTVDLGHACIDLPSFDAVCHGIPSGFEVWDSPRAPFDLKQLTCFSALRNTDRLACSLGTLGGGNHFIEIDAATDGRKYLVIHSGSRNLGQQVAKYHQGAAVKQCSGEKEYMAARNMLVAEYTDAGRQTELEKALAVLKARRRRNYIPDDLCYVSGTCLQDYLHDIEICQRFALLNREKMAEIILERTGLNPENAFHTIHNYIDTETMILRKGAISAGKGETVLIPINMRDGSILAVGKGDPDWNFSAPHGAGRILSRGEAKEILDMDEYRNQMSGIYTTSVSESTLDEAPMAYKSLSDIIGNISDTVDVIDVLKPIYNFKA